MFIKRLTAFAIVIIGLMVLPQIVNAQACNCWPTGSSSDQGCMANGCPTGTRRVCNCNPGGTGGTCSDENQCGGSSMCGGLWSCYCQSDPSCTSGGTGNPPDPGCTPVAPSAPTSIYTRNPQTVSSTSPGRTVRSNILRAGWSGGNYGNGCPTVESNDVQIRPNDLSLGWTSYGNVSRVDSLEWNTTYRWRVRRTNGNSAANSVLSYFSTGTPPSISNFNIGSQNTCSASAGYIGTSANGANNPLIIEFDVTDPDNNFAGGVNIFRNARIALTPTTNVYRRYDLIEPGLHQPSTKNAAGFRVDLRDLLTTNTRKFLSTDYADGTTGASSTTGTHTNAAANATLLDINGIGTYSSSVTQINNQTVRVKFVVRLEDNFANGQFHIFATVLSRKDDYNGNELIPVSQDPLPSFTGDGDGNLRYRNFTLGGPVTYQIDRTAPTAAVGNPQVTGANSFNVAWSASDNVALAIIRSYCYRLTAPGVTIRDVGLGTNIGVGTSELSYPSADNCLVNTSARLGLRSYTDQSGSLNGGINFRLHVVDNACNSATATSTLNASGPWMMTGNGNASANGGFNSFNINDTSYNFNNLSGNKLTPPPFLASYLALSGTSSVVTNKPSANSFVGTNYIDNKIIPPQNLASTNWADTIKNIISQQPGYAVDNTSVRTLATGNLSTTFGVSANSYAYRYFSGHLVIPAGVICNIKAVIVVELNTSISPNFLTTGTNNGCIIVSKGRIQTEYGPHSSSGGAQQYDQINALLITDSIYYDLPDYAATGYDKPNPSLPADGLYIRGGVIANQVSFRRDLEPTNNASYPANIIEYDPTYLINFGSILANKKFSLRQE